MENVWLTTTDNEWNPFTHFDEWYSRDCDLARKQHRPTCLGYLARKMHEDDDVSDEEYAQIVESIIDEICKLNLSGTFLKITEKQAEKRYGS